MKKETCFALFDLFVSFVLVAWLIVNVFESETDGTRTNGT